jgi:predicted AlkP superfamily pyrophosphatase or phosphodiesterase
MFAYMGIDYSIETGISIDKLKVWNEHKFVGFDVVNQRVNGSLFNRLVSFIDRCSINDNLNKALRFGIFKVFKVGYGIPHLIPAKYLKYFPAVDNDFPDSNLFKALEGHGIKILRREPKLNRSEAKLIKSIPNLLINYDLLLFKLNSLDRLGHKFGPLSQQVKDRVKFLDGLVKELVTNLPKDIELIIMSDHGMVPVHKSNDLIANLENKHYTFGLDYFAYVGATYTAFWFKNEAIRQKMERDLNTLDFGRVLTSQDKQELGISNVGLEYGELFFVNNEHTVSFPEFYHTRKMPAGMHGYAFNKYDSPIFILLNSSKKVHKVDEIKFVDIMPTVLDIFGVSLPEGIDGKSILKQPA